MARVLNYLALMYSIERGCPPERAFDVADGVQRAPVTIDVESEEILELRAQGLTYEEIGDIYGMHKGAVHKRVSRLLKRKGESA